ncbi:hypothetical protein ACETU7_26770 [Rhodococcus sp. 3Y1]
MFRLYCNSAGPYVLCCAHFPEFTGSNSDEEFSVQQSFDRAVEKILRDASFEPTTLTLVGEQQGYPSETDCSIRQFRVPEPSRTRSKKPDRRGSLSALMFRRTNSGPKSTTTQTSTVSAPPPR